MRQPLEWRASPLHRLRAAQSASRRFPGSIPKLYQTKPGNLRIVQYNPARLWLPHYPFQYFGRHHSFEGERRAFEGERRAFEGERRAFEGERRAFEGERRVTWQGNAS
jgi:hypothetical protein